MTSVSKSDRHFITKMNMARIPNNLCFKIYLIIKISWKGNTLLILADVNNDIYDVDLQSNFAHCRSFCPKKLG